MIRNLIFPALAICMFNSHAISQESLFNFEIQTTTTDYTGDILELNSQNLIYIQNSIDSIAIHGWVNLYKVSSNGAFLDSTSLNCDLFNYSEILRFCKINEDTILAFGSCCNSFEEEKLWVVKLDTNFNEISSRYYNLNLKEIVNINSIEKPDGSFLIYGTEYYSNAQYQFFLSITSDLDSINSRVLDQLGYAQAYGIIANEDNSYTALAYWPQIGPGGGAKIVLFDSAFEYLSNTPTGIVNYGCSFIKKENGNFLISGKNSITMTGLFAECGVVEFSENAGVISSFFYGEPDTIYMQAWINSISSLYDNEIYFGGTYNFPLYDFYNYDSWILINKLDSDLNLEWQKFIGGEGFYNLQSIRATNDHGVAFSYMKHYNSYLNSNVGFGKLDSEGNIISISEEIKTTYGIQISPNPGSEFINIRVENLFQEMTVTFVDVSGRIKKISGLDPGSNFISTINLDSGIYFILISLADKTLFKSKWVKI